MHRIKFGESLIYYKFLFWMENWVSADIVTNDWDNCVIFILLLEYIDLFQCLSLILIPEIRHYHFSRAILNLFTWYMS